MAIRLSDVGEYSQAFAQNGSVAPQVPAGSPAPMVAAKYALTRGPHGLALTEVRGPTRVRQTQNGLGELVQVVT